MITIIGNVFGWTLSRIHGVMDAVSYKLLDREYRKVADAAQHLSFSTDDEDIYEPTDEDDTPQA